jgi:biotin transport system substrate-specific component
MKIRIMVFTALFAAVLCVVSPFSIPLPFSPVPLSLATLAIYLAASVMNWKTGTLSVILYVLIGLVGVPVFSKFGAGVQQIVGPTGGFIVGYIPMALAIGLMVDRLDPKKWVYPVSMVIGTVILYACGTVWFMISLDATLTKALTACAIPFLPGDAAKIVVASIIAPILRKALKKQRA